MDDKVNYGLVGAFVLVLGAALVAGILWLAAGIGRHQEVDPYQAFIQESVAGLNVDAPVKYLGVDVGKVTRIDIDPNNPEQVRLRFFINQGTPIKQDTEAVLKTQGLTGIAYVELSGGTAASPPLTRGSDGSAPTIPFKPSLSARLENVLSNVLANVDRVSDNLNAMFDAGNRAAVKSTLTDLAAVAHTLAEQRATLAAGVKDAARTARVAAQAVEQIAPAMQRVGSSAQAVERMADKAGAASAEAGRAARTAAQSVQHVGTDTLPELERLMGELRQLAGTLRQLSEQTTQNPNSLVIGAPTTPPGPGEKAAP